MEAHPLAVFAAELSEKYGAPHVLDVEHSIQAHRPTLTGTTSPSSYYIRPPEGLSAEQLIKLFHAIPGFENLRLTLTPIFSLDTYHQPLISVDDFAKKYFADSHQRILRVEGQSNPALQAMAAFIEGLKRPFTASEFPHHGEFMVSGYRPAEGNTSAQIKLLFKPADPTQLMKIERLVKLHLDDFHLGREIGVSRHYTREQPPELILSSPANMPKGNIYLDALALSLPQASVEEVKEAVFVFERTPTAASAEAPKIRAHFGMNEVAKPTLSHEELMRRAIACLAGILRQGGFGGENGLKIVQGGTGIDVEFPRSAKSLWLASSFDERRDINTVKGACIGVRSDPNLRDGWDLHYRFDGKEGKLQLRAAAPGASPLNGGKLVPLVAC